MHMMYLELVVGIAIVALILYKGISLQKGLTPTARQPVDDIADESQRMNAPTKPSADQPH